MDLERNKQLVATFFDNLNANRIDEAFAMVSDDVRWWVPGTLPFSGTRTKQEYLGVVRRIQSGFPKGLQLMLRGTTAEADRVAAEVESYGEHVNGKKYQNKYHFLFTLQGGQIVAVKEYMDTLHLAQLLS